MGHRSRFLVGFLVGVALVLAVAPPGAATTYTVNTNPYTVHHTLLSADLFHSYELVAANGDRVAYSFTVTTTGGCASLLFAQGHSITGSSQYYVFYSEENCAASYSNTFPVSSNDGTRFSVVMVTDQATDVSYDLTISVTTPVIPSWLLGLIAVIIIGAVIGAVVFVIRRRRAPKMLPPTAPPYPPMPPMEPPVYPPQAPPQEPPQQPPMGP